MIRMKFSIGLQYEIAEQPGDFIFNLHAAKTRNQTVIEEHFSVNQPVAFSLFTDDAHGNRYTRLRALPGHLEVHYDAVVDISHHIADPQTLHELPIADIPPEVVRYLYPSRYCQSDRLHALARSEFGTTPPGYWRVRAIQDWVHRRTRFLPGSSKPTTSAVDTLIEQVGVCRDFAHLMISICRALNMPARFATSIDYGADPIWGPMDFHAYVEVFLGDRWWLFDPTGMTLPMGLVRIGTGHDAANVSFSTMFGQIASFPPVISIEAVEDEKLGLSLPYANVNGLSTDGI